MLHPPKKISSEIWWLIPYRDISPTKIPERPRQIPSPLMLAVGGVRASVVAICPGLEQHSDLAEWLILLPRRWPGSDIFQASVVHAVRLVAR